MTYAGYEGGDPIKPWLRRSGVDLKTTFINNQDDVTTRLRTPAGRRTDAAQLGLAQLDQYRELGLAYPLQPEWFSNLDAMIPFFKDLVADDDGTLTTMPFVWGGLGCNYLPSKTGELTSWRELTEPRFKNRIAMIDDPVSTVQTGALAVGIRDPSRMTVDQLAEVKEFLLAVKANARTVAAGYGDIADLLAAGDVWASFQGWNAVESFAGAKGAVVKTAYPQEGTVGFVDSFFVQVGAESKGTAVAFIDQMISKEMQAYCGNDLASGIVRLDAAPLVRGPAARAFDYDRLDELFRTKLVFALDAPLRGDGDVATHEDWVATWEDVKAA
nr:extracellular solute-binding protein [Conexibacter arvalis]